MVQHRGVHMKVVLAIRIQVLGTLGNCVRQVIQTNLHCETYNVTSTVSVLQCRIMLSLQGQTFIVRPAVCSLRCQAYSVRLGVLDLQCENLSVKHVFTSNFDQFVICLSQIFLFRVQIAKVTLYFLFRINCLMIFQQRYLLIMWLIINQPMFQTNDDCEHANLYCNVENGTCLPIVTPDGTVSCVYPDFSLCGK